jgi:hypothetical protein
VNELWLYCNLHPCMFTLRAKLRGSPAQYVLRLAELDVVVADDLYAVAPSSGAPKTPWRRSPFLNHLSSAPHQHLELAKLKQSPTPFR